MRVEELLRRCGSAESAVLAAREESIDSMCTLLARVELVPSDSDTATRSISSSSASVRASRAIAVEELSKFFAEVPTFAEGDARRETGVMPCERGPPTEEQVV